MGMNMKKRSVQSDSLQHHIPHEIIAEILYRLHTKSLARFKCVSKVWQSLISDSMKSRERGFFYINKEKITFYSVDNQLVVQELPSPFENCAGENNFKFHGSCNGLLLFSVVQSVHLWNPYTRWCKEVLQFDTNIEKSRPKIFGLCYDDSTDDYKLLIAFEHGREVDKNFVLVISLRSKEWTKVSFPYATVKPGCFASGRLHWIVQEVRYAPDLIVYFDTKSNDFIKLPTRKPVFHIHQLGVLDGFLSMAEGTRKFLVMREYGVKESWRTVFMWRWSRWSRGKRRRQGWFVKVPGFNLITSKELLAAKFCYTWFTHVLDTSVWYMGEDNLFKLLRNIHLISETYKLLRNDHIWETYYESLACPDIRRLLLEIVGDEINLSLNDSVP